MNILYLGVARVQDKCPIADYAAVDSREHPKIIFTQKFDKLLNCFHPQKRPRLTITDKDVGHIHYNSDTDILLAGKHYRFLMDEVNALIVLKDHFF